MRVHRWQRLVTICAAGWLAGTGIGALAGERPPVPEWMAGVATGPAGDFPLIGPASLTYTVSWNGVLKAGEAKVLFRSGDDVATIHTLGTSRSIGAARLLWPYDAKVESQVHATDLRPLLVDQWEEDRDEENVYRTTFAPGAIHNVWTTKPKKNGKPDEERNRVFRQEPVHDLVSGMLYLRSLPWTTKGETVGLIVFPFRDPYFVGVTFLGSEKRKHGQEMIDALKFDLQISTIRKGGKLEPISSTVKSASFWISDDEQRLPLEMRAEIFVGSIRVELTDFQLLPSGEKVPVLAESAPPVDGVMDWSSKAKGWLGRLAPNPLLPDQRPKGRRADQIIPSPPTTKRGGNQME